MAEIKLQKRYKYTGDIAKELAEHSDWAIEDIMEFLNSIPDADVAPRAAVAREIFAELEEIADTHYGTYSVLNTKDYCDLKKKYKEGQK